MIEMFFSPISQSVPHIYLSMLPLAEEDSLVSTHYLRWTSSLVSVKRKGVRRRSPLLKLLEGHADAVTAVTVSHDGMFIASASNDGTIRVWDEKSGNCIASPLENFEGSYRFMASLPPKSYFEVLKHKISSIVFSPDDKRIIAAGPGSIKVVDVESGSRIASHYGDFKQNKVCPVAISYDGELCARVSAIAPEAFEIWDIESGRTVAGPFIGHTEQVSSLSFTRDGRYIASGSADNSIRVWKVQTRLLAYGPFLGHTSRVNSVDFSPNGKHVVSGSWDKTIRIWNLESGEAPFSPICIEPDLVDQVAFSPDGINIVAGTIQTARVYNAQNGNLFSGPFLGHTHWISSIVFYQGGTRVISGSSDRTIRIWDAEIGKISSRPELVKRISSVKFSADSSCIISNDGTMWNVSSGEIVDKSRVEDRTRSLVISDDMQFSFDLKDHVLAFPEMGFNYEERIFVWDAHNGSVNSHQFQDGTDCPTYIAAAPNGRIFALGSGNGTIRVWDQGSNKLVCGPFKTHGEKVFSLVFSADGTLIASGLDDHVSVWRTATGELVCGPFRGHGKQVSSVDISPDGCYVVSGSRDSIVRVWDVATGISDVFEGHTHGVFSVSYSPDGSRIVSSSENNEIRIWNARMSETRPFALAKSNLHNNSIDTSTPMWTSSKDGWIRGSHDELLLWVPPDIRLTLITPSNIAILNCEFVTALDFTGSVHGKNWQICFNSLLSESKARRYPDPLKYSILNTI